MGRKKRGGKITPTTRRTRASLKNIEAAIESVIQKDRQEDEPPRDEDKLEESQIEQEALQSEEDESNSSESKSCNTPVEVEVIQPVAILQHKKFGKFRCLIEEKEIKNEHEPEDPAEGEEEIAEGLKCIDLGASCTKEMIETIIGAVATPKTIESTPKPIESTPKPIESTSKPIEATPKPIESIPKPIESTPKPIESTPKPIEVIPQTSKEPPEEKEETSEKMEVIESSNEVEEPLQEDSENKIRRSSRIRSISDLKKKSRGRGVVKSEKSLEKLAKIESTNFDSADSETSNSNQSNSNAFIAPNMQNTEPKPVKVKSRWRRSSELEMNSSPVVTPLVSPQLGTVEESSNGEEPVSSEKVEDGEAEKLRHYQNIVENEYLTERISCREAKKMLCDCFLVEEEIERGELGCGDDCLNRLLMIECGNHCVVGDRCTNKRFQKHQYAPCEVFKTKKKGFGIRATANIYVGDFILEYVGEVLDQEEFDQRASEYSKDKNRHYYFMALRSDAVIDATQKGNTSRFINHSCDPNAETQKWTVNGELRIGFFSTRNIAAGEEITFDYQFQRYGKEAQKCYCEAPTCRGWIGEEPDSSEESEEEEEEEQEEDVLIEKGEIGENKKLDELDLSDKKVDEVEIQKVKKEKRPSVRERRELRKKNQQRKEIFEDLDLDDAIEMLRTTGVKNQTQTLTLSRLMVRAKEINTRMRLLSLLTSGEEPCRRLFLDYHGLRLIHGWMIDLPELAKQEINLFKLEILKALDSLPIKNKTILLDSKVLAIVEKWAKSENSNSPTDSSENSPKDLQLDTKADALQRKFPKSEVSASPSDSESSTKDTKGRSKGDSLEKPSKGSQEDHLRSSKSEVSYLPSDSEISSKEIRKYTENPPKNSRAWYPKDAIKTRSSKSGISNSSNCETSSKNTKRTPKFYDSSENSPKDTQLPNRRRRSSRFEASISPNIVSSQNSLKGKSPGPDSTPNTINSPKDSQSEKVSQMEVDILNKMESKGGSSKPEKDGNNGSPQVEESPKDLVQAPVKKLEQDVKSGVVIKEKMEVQVIMKDSFNKSGGSEENQKDIVIKEENGNDCKISPKEETIKRTENTFEKKEDLKKNSEEMDEQNDLNKIEKLILELCSKLLVRWLLLKEDFRIPKKERIKQMKAHEREANRGYSAPEENRSSNNRFSSGNRIQSRVIKIKKKPKDKKEKYDRDTFKSSNKKNAPQLTKQERRQLFAIQVAQEEEDRRKHQELLRQHEQRCLMMGQDPKMVPFDPNVPYWNNWTNPNFPPPNMIPINPFSIPNIPVPQPMININPQFVHHPQIVEPNPVVTVEPNPVVFPPPVKLPPKWKCARDKYGRPYYYHVKIRISQWVPPEFNPAEVQQVEQINEVESSEESSSSDTSSLSSDSDSDSSDDDMDDTKLLLEIRNKLKAKETEKLKTEIFEENTYDDTTFEDNQVEIEKTKYTASRKRKREGLITEIIISPRTEEDKLQYRIDAKKYKETKEKLKQQKEIVLDQSRKKLKMNKQKQTGHSSKVSSDKMKINNNKKRSKQKSSKLKTVKAVSNSKIDLNSEESKKIKENFRKAMATTIVQNLNRYRKPDCKVGRITNTEDFKHLARKLTHYVMSKELKHCQRIEDLTCNDSVKLKARDFIRKYMQKFGEVYSKPHDEVDY